MFNAIATYFVEFTNNHTHIKLLLWLHFLMYDIVRICLAIPYFLFQMLLMYVLTYLDSVGTHHFK